ncbi:MAG: nicotinate-nicotinamide nucleotide adenylyltransferase, partial [Solirubrobacteraceae bacterium]
HPDTWLTLVLGADMAMTLADWRRPREILSLARLAVAERDQAPDAVLQAIERVDGGAQVSFLSMAPVAVSSTEVRERLAQARPVEELVGDAVAAYIAAQGLYRSGVGAGVL